MLLVEQHIVEDNTKQLLRMSLISRKLFNKAMTYIQRTNCDYNHLWSKFKHDSLYHVLKCQSSQQILRLAIKTHKSYLKSSIEYKKNSNKYTGKPEPYIDSNKPMVIIYTNQNSQIRTIGKKKKKYIVLSPTLKIPYVGKIAKYQQIRIKHISGNKFKLELIYEKMETPLDPKAIHYMGIDIGLKNICSIGITDRSSYLVDSKALNQNTNNYLFLTEQNTIQTNHKTKKKYKISRSKKKHGNKKYLRNHDFHHKLSRKIVNLAVKHQVKNIVIGHNWDWTRQTNIGPANNRKMSGFGLKKLINLISYKAKLLGIRISIQEESHTSKCDFMSNEDVKHHSTYSGKRITRSSFLSSIGKTIHADINASFNIIKKYIDVSAPHDKFCYEEIQIKGCMYHPSKLIIG